MKNLITYFIEMIIVSFGVFLGIVVSEWNTQRKVNLKTEKTLEFINKEMKSNIRIFENYINYHNKLKQEFDSISENISMEQLKMPYFGNEVFRPSSLPSWKGVGVSKIETIAFESGKINGTFEQLNINTIKNISQVYKLLEGYKSLREILTTRFTSLNSDSKVVDIWGLFDFLNQDILLSEKSIKQSIEKINFELEETIKNKSFSN